MIKVKREGLLLKATDHWFENGGVLNPAVYQEGNDIHMFYRSIQFGGVSMIGYCRLEGPTEVVCRKNEPLIVPEFAYEAYGVEDPRIVKIDGVWHLSYTAFNEVYALGALAVSHDLKTFIKKGIIVPRMTYKEFYGLAQREGVNEKYFSYRDIYLWDKNVIFFPRRIGGKLFFIHRIRPGILLAAADDTSQLDDAYWKSYFRELRRHILLDPVHPHEGIWLGGGCPPLETDAGWLLIYHSVISGPQGYIYVACAALLDRDDPHRVIGRLPYALISPESQWERAGTANNVVFPTGLSLFGDTLYIYYGCADSCIGVASVGLRELLYELGRNPV